jgi:hypothetical protein
VHQLERGRQLFMEKQVWYRLLCQEGRAVSWEELVEGLNARYGTSPQLLNLVPLQGASSKTANIFSFESIPDHLQALKFWIGLLTRFLFKDE